MTTPELKMDVLRVSGKLDSLLGGEATMPNKVVIDFEEEYQNMREMVTALKEIAAAAKERNMWLVVRCEHVHVGGIYSKIRIADIKQLEEWDNGEANVYGINDSPLTEDYAGHTHFSKAEWATRKIMTTMEVLGL